MRSDVEISVCYVTYQACQLLHQSLDSLYQNSHLDMEILVVDNGSTDGIEEMLSREFPAVLFSQNAQNLGFSKPMNQALSQANGKFLLLLNPDTIVLPDALEILVSFLHQHPEVGICGPRVLNPDGSLQKPCRRGDARPWAVISYFSGLSAIFPKSRFFCQYLLSYQDPNQAHVVDGVSGSCMLIKRQVIDQIGVLDERFFAFQEDADYCLRARQAGWQVYYVPAAQIIHFGGRGGSHVDPLQTNIEWHRAYFRLYRKHFARDYWFIFNWLYYLVMSIKFTLSVLGVFFHRGKLSSIPRPLNNKGDGS